ncbi:hypothetical protein [Paenibacillus sp. MMS18-CY102]|uniref:hypothetical protein n=1 Tax=Paenibacillus sp. MMS18-CY102 TaxID=2682849 RepID=UPI0013654A9D|nr:hypothetical protein [Paenibacillus sp. MMS18-CY102]MWC29117.1 hypothetical protein [Paenibacillus sp. MMS18-CY102]
MWKMFSWVGRAIAVGLIASFLSIWTTGYIVNSYVESLLKQYKLPLEVEPFALSGVWGKLWGADTPSGDGKALADSDNGGQSATGTDGDASAGANTPSDAGEGGSEIGDGSDGGSNNGTGTGEAETGAAESGGQGTGATGTNSGDGPTDANGSNKTGASGADGKDGTDKDPVAVDAFGDEEEGPITGMGGGTGPKVEAGATAMTAEEINAAKQQLTDADKNQLFTMLATKLPQNAWQTISAYAEDGLTEEELTNIQQIVAQHLSEEEYKTFMSILKKY